MILADTSIWIDHFRTPDAFFRHLLDEAKVAMHPVVIGEIALSNLRNRREVLQDLKDLPQAVVADDEEVLHLIDVHILYGTGIGYADAELLASTMLSPGLKFWTNDKRLRAQAEKLGVHFQSH
jgi:predicted nucleic acid-binding protein